MAKQTQLVLLIVGILALTHVSIAYCPNGCNAQGSCGENDKCTCYLRQDEGAENDKIAMFAGADCSLRTCPQGRSWFSQDLDASKAADGYRKDTECSSRGLCDTATGVCNCFPGFEGKACDRSVCPNNCNGHGICKTLKDIIAAAPTPPAAYNAWDGEMYMGCVCDLGFRGPDCSLRECPSGDDVLLGDSKSKGRECGGRGKCNTESGICDCFPGYFGTSCDKQTTVN